MERGAGQGTTQVRAHVHQAVVLRLLWHLWQDRGVCCHTRQVQSRTVHSIPHTLAQ